MEETGSGESGLYRQFDALNAADCERVLEDHPSGAAPKRSQLATCLDHLRRDDVLVVLEVDRPGRRASELITLIDKLVQRGVGFRARNLLADTTTPAGRTFLRIQAAFVEMERKVIRQCIQEGAGSASRPATLDRPRIPPSRSWRAPPSFRRPPGLPRSRPQPT